ncbi:MAG: ATP-binding protein, partial [Psychrosphaera sp.]|nr:ATP-binding protein [Psychrosphaera sp.]
TKGVTDSFNAQNITVIKQMDNGVIWLGTRSHGVARIDQKLSVKRFSLVEERVEERGEERVEKNAQPWVSAIIGVGESQVWVSAYSQGAIVLDATSGKIKHNWRHDGLDNSSLSMDMVGAMLVDKAGMVWVGTWGQGLNQYNPGNDFATTLRYKMTGNHRLTKPSVMAIQEMQNAEVWLGMEAGGINRWLPTEQQLKPITSFAKSTVVCFVQTKNGQIWAGTLNDGLLRFVEKAEGALVSVAGLVERQVITLAEADNNNLWVGTSHGVYYFDVNDESFTPVLFDEGNGQLIAKEVRELVRFDDGRLWAASLIGFYQYDQDAKILNKVRINPQSKTTLSVMGLLIDNNERLWVATNQGLYYLDDDNPNFIDADQHYKIDSKFVFGTMMQDNAGRIWSPSTIFDPGNGSVLRFGENYGIDVGAIWHRAGVVTSTGLILLGGNQGLLMIRPEKFKRWSYQPPLVVTQAKLGNQIVPLTADKRLEVTPDIRSLAVEFAALDMSSPQSINYQYRLNGFDEQWVGVDTKHRIANYTNLDPGVYDLQVRHSDRHGDWFTPKKVVNITVIPAWYQTVGFKLLCAVLLAALLYGLYLLRVRHLKLRKKILKALVKQRTKQLALKNQEALDTMENLIATQAELAESEKQVGLGKMVAGVSHELNTPLGIGITAISLLETQVDKLKNQMQSGKLTKAAFERFFDEAGSSATLVNANLHKASDLVASFKQVSGEQFDQFSEFDLSGSIDTVIASLQDRVSAQQHSLDYRSTGVVTINSCANAFTFIITVLVENALAHAFDGQSDGQISVSIDTVESDVVLKVTDNGKGIEAEALALIFDPFYTSKRGSGYCGLGLHTVFNVVHHKLGGSIDCLSQPGQGCCFVISLKQ